MTRTIIISIIMIVKMNIYQKDDDSNRSKVGPSDDSWMGGIECVRGTLGRSICWGRVFGIRYSSRIDAIAFFDWGLPLGGIVLFRIRAVDRKEFVAVRVVSANR